MKRLQRLVSLICAGSLALGPAYGQQWSWQKRQRSWFTDPYRPKEIPPADMTDSRRLEALVRAGNLYLSLRDAIALALENNLNIALQRYGPQIAEADLLRAKAGGLLRGIPQTVQTDIGSVEAQVVGGETGGAGGTAITARRQLTAQAAGTTATEAGGAVITATGTALPNLDPQLFFRWGYNHRTNPLSNTVTTGVTSLVYDTRSWNYGFQKAWLTGTQLSFGWNNNYFESNNPRNDLNPSQEANWQVRITQPLLRGFGIAVNNRNIRIAKNNLKISDLVFEQQVMSTVSTVIQLYWDLVAYAEDVKVKRQALALAQQLYEDNRKQVEIGTLAPIEITRAEAQVARRMQELTASETRLLQQEAILKNAISKTGIASPWLAQVRIIPTDPLPTPSDDDPVSLDELDRLTQIALEQRPEIYQTRINLENTKIGMAGSKSQLLPSLEMSAYFANNGLAGQPNSLARPPFIPNVDPYFVGGYGTVLSQLLRRNFPDYGITFTLVMPLRNRAAQADYIRDMLSLRQQEIRERQLINQIRLEVQNALIAVRQARALYEAAVKERILQEQTLEAEQKKYALGSSTVFFVIQAQRDLAQAQSAEVAALAEYAKAKVALDRALGTLLQTYDIKLEEALRGQVSRPPDPVPGE